MNQIEYQTFVYCINETEQYKTYSISKKRIFITVFLIFMGIAIRYLATNPKPESMNGIQYYNFTPGQEYTIRTSVIDNGETIITNETTFIPENSSGLVDEEISEVHVSNETVE